MVPVEDSSADKHDETTSEQRDTVEEEKLTPGQQQLRDLINTRIADKLQKLQVYKHIIGVCADVVYIAYRQRWRYRWKNRKQIFWQELPIWSIQQLKANLRPRGASSQTSLL